MKSLEVLCWAWGCCAGSRGALQALGSRMLQLCLLQLPLAYPQLSSLAEEAEVFVL